MASEFKLNDEEMYEWYKIFEDQKKSNLNHPKYCEKRGIALKHYYSYRYRYLLKMDKNSQEYKKWMHLADEYDKSDLGRAEFCSKHDLNVNTFKNVITHRKFLSAVQRMQAKENQVSEMTFIEAPQLMPIRPVTEEILPKQNDIELNISKGVKVLISPEIDSSKIIKIIELLKDL